MAHLMLLSLLHGLSPQAVPEVVVQGRLLAPRRGEQARQAAQLLVLQDVVQLRIVARVHSTGLKESASSRSRLTPRWMRSFTAPGDLPIATAMSSIFMSSWYLSTSAGRCW